MQINVATEGVDRAQAIESRLATAEPEDTTEDPVTFGILRMQGRCPGFAGPAPPAQNRTLRQSGADLCADLMQATGRATGAIALAGTVQCRGHRQTQAQLPLGKPIEALIGKGNVQ
ncbi:hypothetical protein D3C75_990050 [compost metagenome]